MSKTPYDYWGIECGEGWKSIYQPLIELCKNEGVKITQIKEKFGGLRFYTHNAPEHVREAIAMGEKEAYETCELCGARGELRRGSWLKTLCDDCNNK